jgi:hypothetical protein
MTANSPRVDAMQDLVALLLRQHIAGEPVSSADVLPIYEHHALSADDREDVACIMSELVYKSDPSIGAEGFARWGLVFRCAVEGQWLPLPPCPEEPAR